MPRSYATYTSSIGRSRSTPHVIHHGPKHSVVDVERLRGRYNARLHMSRSPHAVQHVPVVGAAGHAFAGAGLTTSSPHVCVRRGAPAGQFVAPLFQSAACNLHRRRRSSSSSSSSNPSSLLAAAPRDVSARFTTGSLFGYRRWP